MLKNDILLKSVYNELKSKGMEETDETERVAIGYVDKHYNKIKYNGLEFEVRQSEDTEYLFDDLQANNEKFIVNYHSDFWVTKDEIITKGEVEALYTGEISWRKVEKEKGYWIFELSCLVHSGVWLNFDGEGFVSDSQGWDTSRVGLVLVSKKIAKTRKEAEAIGKELVDTWNMLLSDDVYEITIKKDGEEIDRINGIIGEAEVYEFIKDYKI